MNKREFDYILQNGESYLVEFKEKVNSSLAREMTAFANASGSTSLSDDVINFKKQTLKDLQALEAVVRPGLSQNHTAQFIDNAIKAFFNTVIDRKKHGG